MAFNGVKLALDLTDAVAVDAAVAREKPDAIVHLAGQASIGAAHTQTARPGPQTSAAR